MEVTQRNVPYRGKVRLLYATVPERILNIHFKPKLCKHLQQFQLILVTGYFGQNFQNK